MGKKFLRIEHRESGHVLAKKVQVADNVWDRLIGLMFAKGIGNRDGLLIKPCKSIHTFFVRYNLDILFLDKEDNVVKLYRNLRPWRMTPLVGKAKSVLELVGGSVPETVKVGDKLEVTCIN